MRYAGAVPDPFREGREVIVTVRRRGAAFVGEKDSLVTKCPSKFRRHAGPADVLIAGGPACSSRSRCALYGVGASIVGVRDAAGAT